MFRRRRCSPAILRARCRCASSTAARNQPVNTEITDAATIRACVRRFIAETFFVEGYADDASFLGEAIVDSTGMLELVMFIETTFGFKIADRPFAPLFRSGGRYGAACESGGTS